ncbi:MAG: PQQ-binding-like beta-propeller repeat protein [Gemmatimonadota bacterium]|nr:PQQ-binding-like beta-propeller repeat protein [Gemmatimonadota bacterium]
MAREPKELLFVGIKDVAIALNPEGGGEVWRTKLKGGDFVTVLWDGQNLYAANYGVVYRLDPVSGAIIWTNPMKGLRTGVVSLASVRGEMPSRTPYETIAAQKRREAAAAGTGGEST